MTKRKVISKRVRFEVLKRDAFTCQYCGKMPPDTVLHIDHIKPVSKGGTNGILNLVTSCIDCNLGKSNIELSDDSAVKKQQSQLAILAEKKAQIEMMVEWRESLIASDEIMVDSVISLVDSYLVDYHVNEQGRTSIRKAVKKHGYTKVVDAIEALFVSDSDFRSNWAKAIKFASSQRSKNNIHYIKGILRNRFTVNEKVFYANTSSVEMSDQNYSAMLNAAKSCKTQTEFYEIVEAL